jgi:hypothetical protein
VFQGKSIPKFPPVSLVMDTKCEEMVDFGVKAKMKNKVMVNPM